MTKKNLIKSVLITSSIILTFSCHKDEETIDKRAILEDQIISNYTEIVYQNYLKAYNDAVTLETALTNFTNNPSQNLFDQAKDAWRQARESYGTTEAFRFIDGPIDDTNGPEALMNAWPLDENYIDYIDSDASSGIINNPITYPNITKTLLETLNEDGGEKNISVGYHAIEFLLWGQDLTTPSNQLAGQRPYTDYIIGGTASNQDRRAEYLKVCADLLTDHLYYLVEQWKPNGVYRNTFLALNNQIAIEKMFTGAIVLVYSELAVERTEVALYNQDQEDEHSCFSDNTHRDIRLNLEGVINVYKGTYGNISGSSLKDLVRSVNSSLADDIEIAITDAVVKTNATMIPFDAAIKDGPTSIEGAKVKSAVNAMQLLGSNLKAGAQKLGINIQ